MASNKVICWSVLFLCAVWIHGSSGSAIPMWEYLGRGEKMSHLYTMFAKQVNTFCKTNTADSSMKPQCKRDLLMHGLSNLNKMDETHLDSMDPYQRGATDLVWDHMMDGHPMMAGKKEVTTPPPVIRESAGEYQQNPLFDEPAPKKQVIKTHEEYAMGMDSDPMNGHYESPKEQENLYPEQLNHLQETKISENYVDLKSSFLGGPMMIMVRPDGTPVHSHLPKDDDQEAMTLGRETLPTLSELARSFGTTRNFLNENHDIASTAYPVRDSYGAVRFFEPQKRSFNYRARNLRQGNQH